MRLSMKQAAVSFTIPGFGRTQHWENRGCVCPGLRAAIIEAKRAFYAELKDWNDDWTERKAVDRELEKASKACKEKSK